MPLYTLAEIKAKIEALDGQIAKTETKQAFTSGGPGSGAHEARGDLLSMYKERQYWIGEYKAQEARETGGNTGFVQFERPA
jgi:hypothetical protein